MNGQQLFYSFLPGVTVAVLTAQPSLANTLKVDRPELVVFPASISSSISIVDRNLQPQIRFDDTDVAGNIIKNLNLESQIPSSDQFNSVDATVGAVMHSLTVMSSDLIASSRQDSQTNIASTDASALTNLQLAKQELNYTNLLLTIADFYEPELVSQDNPDASTTKPNISNLGGEVIQNLDTTSAKKINSPSKLEQKITTTPKNTATLPTIAQIPANDMGASALTQPQNRTSQWLAQSSTPTSQPSTIPVAPIKTPPTTSVNVNSLPPRVEVPSYLNPNPNPLQFPTKPSEVQLLGTQPITLAQALELARRNNTDLKTALLQVESSRAALRQAQAQLLPNLSVTSDITRQRSASSELSVQLQNQGVPLANQQPPAAASTAFEANAQLTYNLYTSGRVTAAIRQAEEQLRVSELALETESETLRLTVTSQYYSLQLADEQIRINQSAVVNAQASLRDGLALLRAGVGTQFDVLQFQVNLANAQQNLTNAIAQQRIAQRQLATTLNVSQSVNLSAADPVQLAGLWNQTLEDSIIQAFQNRPELQQQLAQRNIGEQQRRQAWAQVGPQVSLVAGYSLLDQYADGIPVSDGYSIGLQASLTLYDGGAARAQADQAKTAIAIAEVGFTNQRDQIRFQVEQAYYQLQSNLVNVQTSTTALGEAREAVRLARLRFQAGVGTQTDVITAENALTVAEGNRVQAIINYNNALASIQRAVTIRGTR